MKFLVSAIAAVLLATSAQAVVLLSSGELNNPGDLTRVDNEDGRIVEYLDPILTLGLSGAQAEAMFAADGFALATFEETALLGMAFDLGSVSPSSAFSNTFSDANAVKAQALINELGGLTDGGLNNLLARIRFTASDFGILCASTNNCRGNVFIGGPSTEEQIANSSAGNLLARSTITAVPVPAALPMIITGVVILFGLRRRGGIGV